MDLRSASAPGLRRASTAEFRQEQAEHLDAVEAGEHIGIFKAHASAPRAVLVPPEYYDRSQLALRLVDSLGELADSDLARLLDVLAQNLTRLRDVEVARAS